MATVQSLKAPVVAPGAQVWPLSSKAYHALGELGLIPEKTELLYGRVFHKAPKSPLHALLFLRLLRMIQNGLRLGFHVRPEQPILCGDSEPEPDISVLRGSMEDYGSQHPTTAELAIEVCVSSHEYDRSKLAAYASAGVKEVWLVLAPEKQIEIYRRPSGREFTERVLVGPESRVTTPVIETPIDVAVLFAQ